MRKPITILHDSIIVDPVNGTINGIRTFSGTFDDIYSTMKLGQEVHDLILVGYNDDVGIYRSKTPIDRNHTSYGYMSVTRSTSSRDDWSAICIESFMENDIVYDVIDDASFGVL